VRFALEPRIAVKTAAVEAVILVILVILLGLQSRRSDRATTRELSRCAVLSAKATPLIPTDHPMIPGPGSEIRRLQRWT
jgi:hypothetical protein